MPDKINQPDPEADLPSAFEKITGLHLCVKMVSGAQTACASPISMSHHASAFCTRVKRTQDAKCARCDLHDVPQRCRVEKKAFLHTCHAGATEIIYPIIVNSQLRAIAYVGQFRLGKTPVALPKLYPARLNLVRQTVEMFGAWLRQAVAPAPFTTWKKMTRREEVEFFIAENLSKSLQLEDVARHFGISATRAGHLVKELTGESFTTLRDKLRLERAQGQLRLTLLSVTSIAHECGFSNPQHFHRFFRSRMKMTPLAYREAHRGPT